MLLDGKNAVIYGAGGAIGGAAARAFAREGAAVFLAGRRRAPLEALAEEIRAAGATAETAEVDALDEQAVDAHADAVAAQALVQHRLVRVDRADRGQAQDPEGLALARRGHCDAAYPRPPLCRQVGAACARPHRGLGSLQAFVTSDARAKGAPR